VKDFGVQVWFKPIMKVTWVGANKPGDREFDQFRYVDVTETLVVRPQYEKTRFVTAYLTDSRTGTVHAVIDDEESYKLVVGALVVARARQGLPKPFTMGMVPPLPPRLKLKPKKKARKK
jgi:hypothetical protein